MIWLGGKKKKKAVVISIQERALLTSPAAQADLCSITPTRISSGRHKLCLAERGWVRRASHRHAGSVANCSWDGGQRNHAGLFKLPDFPKGDGFPYSPCSRPSFDPLRMCCVAGRYPPAVGLITQLHVSIIVKGVREKSHVQRNIDF